MELRRLLIATDAWTPQVNGVVRTLLSLTAELRRRGIEVEVLSPDGFPTWPLPTYPDIRIAWPDADTVDRRLDRFAPDHVHIATEGPIGWAMRKACIARGLACTTSYHTRFPEYLRERAPIPLALSYAVLRRFHNASAGTMVATASIEADLAERGFTRLQRWGRGVDLARFSPNVPATLGHDWPRPIFLSVGRLAPEKNLDAFLSLDLPGTMVVVGDGPSGARLRDRYRHAVFLGARRHDELAGLYAHADAFVFPSLTDTFGLVLIEALACGLPVAAFPVAGPRDIVGAAKVGVLSQDLRQAALAALSLDREACRRHARGFTWEASTDQFLANVKAARCGTWPAEHRHRLGRMPERPIPSG